MFIKKFFVLPYHGKKSNKTLSFVDDICKLSKIFELIGGFLNGYEGEILMAFKNYIIHSTVSFFVLMW